MRIIKLLTVISIFIFTLYGCKGKSTTPNDNTNNGTNITANVSPTAATNITNNNNITGTAVYKDGTYDIKHKSTKPGFEEAVVTIQNDNIQNIELKRLDDNEVEVNYDVWDGTGEYPNLKQDRIDLAEVVIILSSNVFPGNTRMMVPS